MTRTTVSLAVLFGLAGFAAAADPQVVFQDSFKGKLGEGWTWVRENPAAWKATDKGLEIKVEPGVAATVKNAIVRPAPDRSKGKYAAEVTVEFTRPPSKQFEQGGITLYQGQNTPFKLVHEFIDGKTWVVPGKKPTDTQVMRLRLVMDGETLTSQYRPDGKGPWQTADVKKLPIGADEKLSVQCYNGPPDAEHWIRFSDFRIVKE